MRLRSLVMLSLTLCATLALAQQQPAAPQGPPPPAPQLLKKTDAPITLDGDLSDAGWQQATVIDRFYETSPGDNTEPKVRTVAYVTYDERYFYIGVRADDPQPKNIRAPFVDRDGVIGTDDNIAIFLDTRNDKRSPSRSASTPAAFRPTASSTTRISTRTSRPTSITTPPRRSTTKDGARSSAFLS